MDGGRGGVKLEESGPASSWFFFSLHSFSMVKLKSNNSITSGLTTCGGCPGEPETVGTSYPFYLSYGPDRSCQRCLCVDCTAIPGVSSVQCVLGQCHIG